MHIGTLRVALLAFALVAASACSPGQANGQKAATLPDPQSDADVAGVRQPGQATRRFQR